MLEFMGKYGIDDAGIVERIDEDQVHLVAVSALAFGQDRSGVEESAYHGGIVTHLVNQVGVEQVNPQKQGNGKTSHDYHPGDFVAVRAMPGQPASLAARMRIRWYRLYGAARQCRLVGST